ncbi:MAG: metallophosphoesterase [Deltaproteobacteria bacterium]|nr:metallophosphoesterase [Deltaproteobacteria bacterium]
MDERFSTAAHTIVVSDLHLADAEELDPNRPLWKRFKQPDLFMDASFQRFLEHVRHQVPGEIELILNGDVFDFDSVMATPHPADFKVGWLERLRGLSAEEGKSRYKMSVILGDHPIFVEAIRDFVLDGNRVVFVIGNHDMELHWEAVREEFLAALALSEEDQDAVRFCEWFYLSNRDTLVEHGNQYDSYCLCAEPIRPLINVSGRVRVRLPFGNVAGKLMLNGMGLFNPHVESSYIRSLPEYMNFFARYVIKVQPFLVWTWLWGAVATLVVSLWEGFLPAVRAPLDLEERVADIGRRSNAEPRVVRTLRALHVHPAIFNPWKIARELWLDRAVLLALLIAASFQLFSVLNLFARLSVWWLIVPFLILLPPFIFYARGVNSDVNNLQRILRGLLPTIGAASGVVRVVLGHTHSEQHTDCDGIELINTGTWSAAYHDVECTQPYGRRCFAWLKPGSSGTGRVAELHEWLDPGTLVILRQPPARQEIFGIGRRLSSLLDGTPRQ